VVSSFLSTLARSEHSQPSRPDGRVPPAAPREVVVPGPRWPLPWAGGRIRRHGGRPKRDGGQLGAGAPKSEQPAVWSVLTWRHTETAAERQLGLVVS